MSGTATLPQKLHALLDRMAAHHEQMIVDIRAAQEDLVLPPTVHVTGGMNLDRINLQLMEAALAKHGGRRKLAAAELGISERTLYRMLPPEEKKRTKTKP